jgi:hypothetical protein
VTRAKLVRRLGWNRNSVDRLFDVNHASRLEQIEAAMLTIGFRVDARLVRMAKTPLAMTNPPFPPAVSIENTASCSKRSRTPAFEV